MNVFKQHSLLENINLGAVFLLFIVTPLFVLPFTENFILDSKWLIITTFSLLLLILYLLTSMLKKQVLFAKSRISLPLLFLAISAVLSSFLTAPYPVENLVGWGSIFILLSLVTLVIPTELPKNTEDLPPLLMGGITVTLLIFSGLQKLGFGPAQLTNAISGAELPSSLLFNVSGSSLVAFQISVLAVAGLSVYISLKKVQPGIYVLLTGSVLSLILFGQALLPGKPTAPVLPSFVTSWSIALDSLRIPKNALLGLGPESYQNAYTLFRPVWTNSEKTWGLRFTQGANTPLTLISTLGIIGLTIWLWMIVRLLHELKNDSNSALKPLKAMLVSSVLLQIIFPLNMVVFTLQMLCIAFFLSNKSETVISGYYFSGSPLLGKKTQSATPVFTQIVLVIFFIATLVSGYLLTRHYTSQVVAQQANKSQQANQGVETYELRQKAIRLNPYLDSHRRIYAQTNLLLAAALAEKSDRTDLEQQQIGQLLQQAIREARAASTIDPLDSRNWNTLATVYRNMIGAVEQSDQWAIQAYVQAIRTNSASPQLRLDLGNIFLTAGQFPQALTFFSQAVELKPDYAQAYLQVARTYEAANQVAQAREGYRQLLALLEQDSEEYVQINKKIEELEAVISKAQNQTQTKTAQEPLEKSSTSITEQELNQPLIETDPSSDLELSVTTSETDSQTATPSGIPQ